MSNLEFNEDDWIENFEKIYKKKEVVMMPDEEYNEILERKDGLIFTSKPNPEYVNREE